MANTNQNEFEATTALPVTEAETTQAQVQQMPQASPAGAPVAATAPAENAERKKTFLHIAIGFVAAAVLITPTTWMVASSTAQNAGPGMSQMSGGMGGPGGQGGQMGGQMGQMNGQSSDGTTDGSTDGSGTTTDGSQQQGQMPGSSSTDGSTSTDSSDSSSSNS